MRGEAPRVAFVIDELGGGGAQRVAVTVANALARDGVPTTIAAARSGAFVNDVTSGVVIRVLAPRWPRPSGVIRFTLGLRSVIRNDRIDVVVTNGFGVARLALLARAIGMLAGTRIVVVEHGMLSSTIATRYRNRASRGLAVLATRQLLRTAAAIISVSAGVARDIEQFLGTEAGTVGTILNPVDAERIHAAVDAPGSDPLQRAFLALERPVVVTAGRLVPAKAHHDLIDAFAALPDTHRGSLVILGEGPKRKELEQQAADRGLIDRVWMPGMVENPWWFMARSDVFALCSHFEGFGLVLAEALACGVPIVATDCPSGPREILEGNPTARLVPVGDPIALSRGIATALEGPRPQGSDALPEQYRPDFAAARYRELILRVLAPDGREHTG